MLQIISAKEKILNSCSNLECLQFPDVDELKDGLSDKLDKVAEDLKDYFEEHSALRFIADH